MSDGINIPGLAKATANTPGVLVVDDNGNIRSVPTVANPPASTPQSVLSAAVKSVTAQDPADILAALAANQNPVDFNDSAQRNLSGVPADVRAYGAVGNGIADDTAAIRAALAANAGKRGVYLPGVHLVSAPIAVPSNTWIVGAKGHSKIKSTISGTNPLDAVFYATYTEPNPTNHGTLAADVKPGDVGANAVNSHGTSPPVITLTYTVAPNKALANVKCVLVRATLGGARGVWTLQWSVDGITWTSATSAATVAMAGTNLTLNIATGNANVDNTWDVAGPCSLTVTGMTVPAVGRAVLLSNTIAGNGTSQEMLDVVAVQGNVLVLESPVVFPFLSGESIAEIVSYPSDITIEGIIFSGTGGQSIEFVACRRPKVIDCEYRYGDGVIAGSALGLDVACTDGWVFNFNSDQRNGSGPVYLQSNKRSVIRGGLTKNAGYGPVLEDCWQCGIEYHWVQETTGGGVRMIQQSAGCPGCNGCWLTGGGFRNGVGFAVEINTANGARIYGYDVDGAGTGYQITSSPNTKLNAIKAYNCRDVGLQANTGSSLLFIDGADIEKCDIGIRVNSGTSDTYGNNIRIAGCITNSLLVAGDFDLSKLAVDVDSTSATNPSPIQHTGGKFKLTGARIACTKANASVIDTSAGVLRCKNVDIATATGANQTGIFVEGTSHAFIEQTTVTGSGGNSAGVDSSGGSARVFVGDGCDFSGTTTPMQQRNGATWNMGTFTSNGITEVSTSGWFPADAAISLSLKTKGSTPDLGVPYPSTAQIAGTFYTKSVTVNGNDVWNWRASGGSAWA